MAEPASTEAPAGEHPELAPLETRLAPEDIAALDLMNAKFLSGALDKGEGGPDDPPPVVPPKKPDAPVVPKPPVPAKPPEAPKPPAPPVPPKDEGLLPPELGEPTPPPAEPAKLPEGKDILTDEDIGKFRTEKAKKDVGTLREHYDKSRTELLAATARIAELEKKTAGGDVDPVILKDLNDRNAKLSAIVERYAIKEHPAVRKQFIEPREAAVARAEKQLGYAKIAPGALKAILEMPDENRIAALDELYESIGSTTIKSNLQSAIGEIDRLDDQFSAFVADREGNIAKLSEQEKIARQKEVTEQTARYSETVDRAFEYLGKTNSFFRKSGKPEHAKWDGDLDADLKDTKEFLLHNDDPGKLLAMGVAASRFTRVYAAYEHLLGQVKAQATEIEQLRGSRPPLVTRSGPVDGNGGSHPGGFKSLVDAGRQAIRDSQNADS